MSTSCIPASVRGLQSFAPPLPRSGPVSSRWGLSITTERQQALQNPFPTHPTPTPTPLLTFEFLLYNPFLALILAMVKGDQWKRLKTNIRTVAEFKHPAEDREARGLGEHHEHSPSSFQVSLRGISKTSEQGVQRNSREFQAMLYFLPG